MTKMIFANDQHRYWYSDRHCWSNVLSRDYHREREGNTANHPWPFGLLLGFSSLCQQHYVGSIICDLAKQAVQKAQPRDVCSNGLCDCQIFNNPWRTGWVQGKVSTTWRCCPFWQSKVQHFGGQFHPDWNKKTLRNSTWKGSVTSLVSTRICSEKQEEDANTCIGFQSDRFEWVLFIVSESPVSPTRNHRNHRATNGWVGALDQGVDSWNVRRTEFSMKRFFRSRQSRHCSEPGNLAVVDTRFW